MENSSSVSGTNSPVDAHQRATALYGRTATRGLEQKANSGYGFVPADRSSLPVETEAKEKENAGNSLAFNSEDKSSSRPLRLLNAAFGFVAQNMAGEDVKQGAEKVARTYGQMLGKLFPNQAANRQGSVTPPSERIGFDLVI